MDDRRQVANSRQAAWALPEPPSAIEFRNRWEMPMAARKKSGSRKSAAKKVARTRKSRVASKKKVAKAPKRRTVTKKKAVQARKKRVVAKKPAAVPRAAVASPAPAPAPTAPAPAPAPVSELDNRIAIVRANLRELVDQAASSAGAANEELLSQRIAEQEERLRRLMQEREQLPQ
jgi:hypothetical protein